jgi:hypothetical protein
MPRTEGEKRRRRTYQRRRGIRLQREYKPEDTSYEAMIVRKNHEIKKHYRSVKQAWSHLMQMTSTFDPRPMVIYACPVCGEYVVGHNDW